MRMLRTEAIELRCDYCGARPNKPCTKVDRNGRRKITWLHLPRELAADRLEEEKP